MARQDLLNTSEVLGLANKNGHPPEIINVLFFCLSLFLTFFFFLSLFFMSLYIHGFVALKTNGTKLTRVNTIKYDEKP
jgi:hypothetical protein